MGRGLCRLACEVSIPEEMGCEKVKYGLVSKGGGFLRLGHEAGAGIRFILGFLARSFLLASNSVMKGIYDVHGIARTLADDENARRR